MSVPSDGSYGVPEGSQRHISQWNTHALTHRHTQTKKNEREKIREIDRERERWK